MKKLLSIPVVAVIVVLAGLPNAQAQIVLVPFSGVVSSEAGATAGDIAITVDGFRAIGQLHPFDPVNFTSGNRQVDWDAPPDRGTMPNSFAGDFLILGPSPHEHGIEFSPATF